MNNKADFFQKKMYNAKSFSRQKKKSKKWVWIMILFFLLLVLGFVWRKFFGTDNGEETTKDIDFSLGEEVYLQGEIKADGDIVTYTHTIDDINYGKIGIKAKDPINLYDYDGFVELTGIVEKFYQGNPIVKVISLSGSLSGSGNLNIISNEDGGEYIIGAGILFLPSFFEEYVLLNEGENGEIRIQNIETEKEIVLNYFRCNPSDPNKNCKGLSESFANNNAQSFVTSEGDVYYKQSEAQSRFVANGERRGIFINDVSDDIVFELKDLIKFANEKNMNEWIRSRATYICQGSGEKMQKINNSDISLKQEGLVVTVSGNGMEKEMTCQILVDFNLPAKGKLQSLTIGEDVVASDDSESEEEGDTTGSIIDGPISATSLDTNVPQFPIKEEGLIYNSSRGGYSLQFPSSNISYSVSSAKENFGRSDISCSYVINVTKYSDKENLEISPAVRIYECQGNVEKSRAPGIVVYPRGNNKFIVQMNDGAWNDFSMNLKFQELTEE